MSDFLPQLYKAFVVSGLALDEVLHGVVAIPFAALLWYKTRSVRLIIVFYLAVYLIDLDHLIDYWLYFGLKLDVIEFLSLNFFDAKGTVFIIFHAWEWVILMYWGWCMKKTWQSVWTAVTLGMFAHLLWDIHNFWSVEFYSIIFRALHGFRF